MKIIFMQILLIFFFTFTAIAKPIIASEYHREKEDSNNQLNIENIDNILEKKADETLSKVFGEKNHDEEKHEEHTNSDAEKHFEKKDNEEYVKQDNNRYEQREQLNEKEENKINRRYKNDDKEDKEEISENSAENRENEKKHRRHQNKTEESYDKNISEDRDILNNNYPHILNGDENPHEAEKEIINSGGAVVKYSYSEDKKSDNEYQSVKSVTYKNDSINIVQTAVISANTGNNSISGENGSIGGSQIETGSVNTNVDFNADFSHDVITYITPTSPTQYVYVPYPVAVYRDYIYTTPTQTYNNYTYPTLNRIYYPSVQTANTYKTNVCPSCPNSSVNETDAQPASPKSTASSSGFGEMLLLGALGGFSVPKVISKLKLLSNYKNS